jgi:hypothetical protein
MVVLKVRSLFSFPGSTSLCAIELGDTNQQSVRVKLRASTIPTSLRVGLWTELSCNTLFVYKERFASHEIGD